MLSLLTKWGAREKGLGKKGMRKLDSIQQTGFKEVLASAGRSFSHYFLSFVLELEAQQGRILVQL